MSQEKDVFQGLGTRALHAGQTPDPTTTARAVPIYATTSYVFHDAEHAANLFGLREFGNIYTRLMNPTTDVLEKRLAALDGGAAGLAFSSGAAAITAALLTIVHAGQNFISVTSLYGGTWALFNQTFAKLGIEVRFFDPRQPESIEALIDENTRAVYVEAPGNPKNDVPDFETITKLAHRHGLPTIIDNTALTPALFRPIEHGFDIVVYSTTKFIGGHGVHLGGAIVDSGKFPWAKEAKKWPEFTEPDPGYHGLKYWDAFGNFPGLGNVAFVFKIRVSLMRDTGAVLSPFNAWQFLIGLETLHLRVPRHSENALAVAQFLKKHPKVAWVTYPGLSDDPNHKLAQKYLHGGFGPLVGVGIKGGETASRKFIDSLKLFSDLANIGDSKSLVIHPASTTHQQLTVEEQAKTGVTPDFVRLSIGTEDIEDIIEDLNQALAQV